MGVCVSGAKIPVARTRGFVPPEQWSFFILLFFLDSFFCREIAECPAPVVETLAQEDEVGECVVDG